MLKLGLVSLLTIALAACSQAPKESADATFSLLSQQVKGQSQVTPSYSISFPKDHGSHPDFAIEWWYITANLTDTSGQDYGLQWTLFRFLSDAGDTPWANEQQYMAHVGLHTKDDSWFEERFARGNVGNAGVSNEPFNAHLDNWQWQSQNQSMFPSQLNFSAENQVSVDLTLNADQPFVLHGDSGYSKKLANDAQASYYYSQPHIQVDGTITIRAREIAVTGQAWFDHEWSSQYLDSAGTGWDWFSIHLDSGKKLMLFNVRHEDYGDFWSGSLVDVRGDKIHLDPEDIMSKVLSYAQLEGRQFPVKWQLSLPEHNIKLISEPIKTDQLHPGLFSYYEGAIKISGSESGVGFMELTGY